MPVSVDVWRQRIGCFYCFKIPKPKVAPKAFSVLQTILSWYFLYFISEFLPFKIIIGFIFLFFYSAVILLSFIAVFLSYGILINFLYYSGNSEIHNIGLVNNSTMYLFPISITLVNKIFACFSINNFHFFLPL